LIKPKYGLTVTRASILADGCDACRFQLQNRTRTENDIKATIKVILSFYEITDGETATILFLGELAKIERSGYESL
jgi:hypothetical protein